MSMIEDLLGADYLLYQLFVCPADAGHFGISRPRTYIYCCHRHTCRHICDIHETYARVTSLLRKRVFTRPRDYFVAKNDEIRWAAMRVAKTRNIPFQPEPWNVNVCSA